MAISLTKERTFFISSILVSGGNYLFNVLMAKWLLPAVFSDVAFLVTILLGVSFLAMSFQLTATKLAVQKTTHQLASLSALSLYTGALIGGLFFISAGWLAKVFQFQDVLALRVYSLVFLGYFIMSVNRGLWQGESEFDKLSVSYQLEMLSRLILSIVAIKWFQLPAVLSVAVAVVCSVLLAMIPWHKALSLGLKMSVGIRTFIHFFYSTLLYELSLVLINNTDIFLVKSYFSPTDSGMYSSIALVGRMIYFFSWMSVMVYIPKMIAAKNDSHRRQQILLKAIGAVFGFGLVACLISYFFAEEIVLLLFGTNYVPVSDLLWKYSIATSLFSCANIFSYYFLTLDIFTPIWSTLIAATLQILLIMQYHPSLQAVVWVQVALMSLLLLWQMLFYLHKSH